MNAPFQHLGENLQKCVQAQQLEQHLTQAECSTKVLWKAPPGFCPSVAPRIAPPAVYPFVASQNHSWQCHQVLHLLKEAQAMYPSAVPWQRLYK